ncbi:MAG: hypothetical protein GY756_27495 [bacterium]|nr:hypothetical protein [bacterium]
MLHKKSLLLFLFLFSPLLLMGDHKNDKVICHQNTRLHIAPSAFSKQIRLIKYGTKIKSGNETGIWLKIIFPFQGYILKYAVINPKKLKKEYSQSKIKKDKMIKDFRKKKTPPTTGTKKGFIKKEVLSKENTKYRYDLICLIEEKGIVRNKANKFKVWRKQGGIGEYSPNYNGGNN